MGVVKNRRFAKNRLKEAIKDPAKVLICHYSHSQFPDDESDDSISPLVTVIVVRSLDDNINEHFTIHHEADRGGVLKEQIPDSHRELELQVLKSFNRFLKRHEEYTWVHWQMKDIQFGFPVIKHRFEKLYHGMNESFHEIPRSKNINLYSLLENMYGSQFSKLGSDDSLGSIIEKNNGKTHVLPTDYLTLDQEGREFEKQNYRSVLKSVECKVSWVRDFLAVYNQNKRVKVYKRNTYAILTDTVSHPIFSLIGFIATLLGTIIGLIAIL